MTDNEIIKALECCFVNKNCNGCPQIWKGDCLGTACTNALDLINRQRADLERLQKYHDDMEDAIYSLREDQAEVKFFKNKIRAEAVKEFAERAKKEAGYFGRAVAVEDIDNLVKEMVGEQK